MSTILGLSQTPTKGYLTYHVGRLSQIITEDGWFYLSDDNCDVIHYSDATRARVCCDISAVLQFRPAAERGEQ